MKRAFITGVTGQVGAYLAQLLLGKGYTVSGLFPRRGHDAEWRLRELGIVERIVHIPGDMLDAGSLTRALHRSRPDEIYNLAAQSDVAESFHAPELTAQVNAVGALRLLEAMREVCPKARFYQASSSEMFGNSGVEIQSETTPFKPRSPYAVSKVFAHQTAHMFHEAHGLWVACGIAFNHESPLRGEQFVTRKISKAVARIKLGVQDSLALGNPYAFRDWGFAGDYVEAMWRIMQQPDPRSWVIATGRSHSVLKFVSTAFRYAGIENWTKLVWTRDADLRPADVDALNGDSARLREATGWKPSVEFPALVSMMVDADMRREERNLRV